jgi:hypothetical protein
MSGLERGEGWMDFRKFINRTDARLAVMHGRRPRCKRNLTISEAFGWSCIGLSSLLALALM